MGWLALVLDLANLIPFRFRGTRSDGAYLLDAMRSRAPGVGEWDDEIEAIVSRWVVLATDFRGAFSARDRDLLGRLNNKMRRAKLDQDDEALSPTPDSLEQGYRRARANAQLRELPEPKARVAFCFGVAMHDVATIAG